MLTYSRERSAAEFDEGYANRITPDVVTRWETYFRERSRDWLDRDPPGRELAYGAHPRQRIDFFPSAVATPGAPTLIAIHGGLRFLFDKWMMHFLVPAFTAAGVHVACPSYRLAPGASLDAIVQDCRQAVAHLALHAGALGLTPGRFTVLGHSAAGQLAAVLGLTDWRALEARLPDDVLRSWVGVSGFYDIEPFARTQFQPLVNFSPESYRCWNPARLMRPDTPPAHLITGGEESELLHEMMHGLARLAREAAVPVQTLDAAGEDHFSVLMRVGDPASAVHARVRDALFG